MGGGVAHNERLGDSQAEELGTPQQWIRDHLRSPNPLSTRVPGVQALSSFLPQLQDLGPWPPAPSDPGVQACSGWSGFPQDPGDQKLRAPLLKDSQVLRGSEPF